MSKAYKYILYVLLTACAIVIALFYIQNGNSDFSIANMRALLTGHSMIDIIIWSSYVLVGLAVALIAILSIIGLVEKPGSLKRFGITLLIAVVVIGLAYELASGAAVNANVAHVPTHSELKLTDTGLIVTYILFGVTILSILFGGLYNAIKKN
ncbi:MAG: hypothetical protein WCS34_09690 [Bacteroidales bacterium]